MSERKLSNARTAILFSAGAISAIALVGAARWTTAYSAGETRAPASIDRSLNLEPGKLDRLRDSADIRTFGKARLSRPFDVQIRAEPATAAARGEPLRLIATVVARSSIERLELAWSVPADVTLANGRAQDALIGMAAGERREVEIEVVPQTDENRKIEFVGAASLDARAQGFGRAGAVYNTVNQPAIDAEMDKNAKLARERYGADVADRIRE